MNGTQISAEAVRKWHAHAERRRRPYVELYRSEKLSRHYSEEAFAMLMRDVIQNVESWSRVLEGITGPAMAKAA